MCIIGTALLFAENGNIMLLVGNLALVAVLFSERLSGWYAVPPGIAASACLVMTGDPRLMMIPVMFFSFYGMYCTGILRGGADAKALMSITLVFPFFPETAAIAPVFPAGYVFCPSFCVLVMALLLVLVSAIPVVLRNLKNGNGLTVSTIVDLQDARDSFVWPIEDVKDGRIIGIAPSDDPAIYERLRNAGFDKVKVTWKIPFLIPILAAFVITMTVGSPLFLLI